MSLRVIPTLERLMLPAPASSWPGQWGHPPPLDESSHRHAHRSRALSRTTHQHHWTCPNKPSTVQVVRSKSPLSKAYTSAKLAKLTAASNWETPVSSREKPGQRALLPRMGAQDQGLSPISLQPGHTEASPPRIFPVFWKNGWVCGWDHVYIKNEYVPKVLKISHISLVSHNLRVRDKHQARKSSIVHGHIRPFFLGGGGVKSHFLSRRDMREYRQQSPRASYRR